MAKKKTLVFVLEKYLKKNEISKYSLAKKMNVNPYQVTRWCDSEYSPKIELINSIAASLNCSPMSLLELK